MSSINILLYSVKGTLRLSYNDSDGKMTTEIERTFMRRCNIKHMNSAWAFIEVCPQTRCAVEELTQKFDEFTGRRIRKLKGFIDKLQDNDHFYFFNEMKASVVERRTAIDCIKVMKEGGRPFPMIHNKAFEHYSKLNILFEFHSYGYDGIELWAGHENENNRVCRFCGKSNPDVTFNQKAHAIQEALGNKLLFCFDECDACNHDLAPIEDLFRGLMDFRRAMYHIPRKETTKSPTVLGKQFIIKAGSDGSPILYLMEEKLPPEVDKTKPFFCHLEMRNPITDEGLYKALCKMVIDLIPAKELPHFENTIKWIKSNGDWLVDSLPSALCSVFTDGEVPFKQPVLDIMVNNRGILNDSPYCTAVLWIYDIAYLFSVPLTDVDAGKYKYDDDLKSHWLLMSDLIGIHHWVKQGTSNRHLSTPWVNWEIDPSSPNVKILPKDHPVFLETIRQLKENSDIGMPAFVTEGITLDRVAKTTFEVLYDGKVTEADLRDVTQETFSPVFTIDNVLRKVSVQMQARAFDTTYKIPFFSYSFIVIFNINSFDKYINVEYDEQPTTFAFHVELRNYLFDFALVAAESQLSMRRKGTQFEGCSLDKMNDSDSILEHALYLVPSADGRKYVAVKDNAIHKKCYLN